MKQYPKISIVTPSFNQGQYIEETILSVLNQNYPNLEYIIIDGGSTDNTLDIIKKYENKIKYWVSEPDTGQSNAINKGFKIASGDVLCWLNSDDIYVPDALNKVGKYYMEHPDTYFLFGGCVAFNEKKDITTWWMDYPDNILNYLSGTPFPPQPSSFFSKKVVQKIGLLDETLHFTMDFDYLVKTTLFFPITKTKYLLSKFRHHSNSKTIGQTVKFNNDRLIVYNKLFNTFKHIHNTEDDFKKYNLQLDIESKYDYDISITKDQVELLFLYLLANQVHFSYGSNNYTVAKSIAKVIKKKNKRIYKDLGLSELVLKMTFFTPGMADFIRKIKRS